MNNSILETFSPEGIFTFNLNIEKTEMSDGTFLLKNESGATYLALDKKRYDILRCFDGKKSIQEVLYNQLQQPGSISVRVFYDLVKSAIKRGFLISTDYPSLEEVSPTKWVIGWSETTAIALSIILIVFGLPALINNQAELPGDAAGWITVLLVLCAVLSIANISQACVLHGSGRKVYNTRLKFQFLLPAISVDVRDAFMGGRICEYAVALQAISTPFIISIAVSWFLPNPYLLFMSELAILMLACPFGDTPAHRLLHAFFRKSHELPKHAATFLGKKAIKEIFFSNESSKEEEYLSVYSIYSIIWLGVFLYFWGTLITRNNNDILNMILFAPDLTSKITGICVAVIIIAMVTYPILYQVWIVLANIYTLIRPHLKPAEKKLIKNISRNRPSDSELHSFLKDTILFAGVNNDTITEICKYMSFIDTQPGKTIIRENDKGDTLFIIYSGIVEVCKEDEAGVEVVVSNLGPGDTFGEIALLDNIPRTASVRCLEPCQFLMLTREVFETHLLASLAGDQIKIRIQVCAYLRRHELFSAWSNNDLMNLSQHFTAKDINKGEVVLQEGQQNETFYLIYEGDFLIKRGDKEICTLSIGDYFGEISLLKNSETIASVTAQTKSRCLLLPKNAFIELISHDPRGGVIIENIAEKRLIEVNEL